MHDVSGLEQRPTANRDMMTRNPTINISTPVPEPETYALIGLGLTGLWIARRRKQS
jgi:PEP-CTERM putative exosortase interaction domain